MNKYLIKFLAKILEYSFIALGVVTLPLWFPLLALYVILDPPYQFALLRAQSAQAFRSRVTRRPLHPGFTLPARR